MNFAVCEGNTIDSTWLRVKTIAVGQAPSGKGSPDKYYSVVKDDKPYLLVKIFYEYETPFLSFIVWCDFLFIGMPDHVCYIDLKSFEVHEFLFDRYGLYFGGFYQYSNYLFITSANKLYCFDSQCALVWKTAVIAIDGVVIHYFTDNYLQVSGEWDPPGGWVDYKINIATGETILKST